MNIYAGAYIIPKEDLPTFYNLYYDSIFNKKRKEFLTEKQLEDDGEVKGLKSQYIAQVKDTANKTLAQTDWMLVRKIERSIDVPAETATARAAVITNANEKVAAITAVTTIEQLIAAVAAQ